MFHVGKISHKKIWFLLHITANSNHYQALVNRLMSHHRVKQITEVQLTVKALNTNERKGRTISFDKGWFSVQIAFVWEKSRMKNIVNFWILEILMCIKK